MSAMFWEVLIIAGLGLASVVYGSRVKDQDAKTIGAGMVGAAIGVWTGARQQARNGKNGATETPPASERPSDAPSPPPVSPKQCPSDPQSCRKGDAGRP